jgi:arylsulfatase A
MNRREFLGALAGSAGVAAMTTPAGAAVNTALGFGAGQKRPNIVFMLVDDLGWGDFSCYGDSFHETPNIDQLARDGMKFTAAYAAAPVCSPSRGAIMTGKAPARTHLTEWIPGGNFPHKKLLPGDFLLELPSGIPTLASELKKLGYQTCAVGKWHLGGDGHLPENFGFDFNYGGDNHGHPSDTNHYFGPFQMHNLGGYAEKDYLTDVLTEKAHSFLERAAGKAPFFLYFAEYAVHEPLEERQELIAKYSKKSGHRDDPDPIYAAMVESVDAAVGKLRKKLTELGVADDTIIILTSDNGGVYFAEEKYPKEILHRVADNGPFRAGKGFLYEGGIREPFIVHWPGVTKAGTESATPVYGPDIMPTLLSIAGGGKAPEPCDGIDISPIFRGSGTINRTQICWHYPHYANQGSTPTGAIREGDWKLIEFFEDGHVELYNLAHDSGEQFDLSSVYPERAVALRKQLIDWRTRMNAAMPAPNPNYEPSKIALYTGPKVCGFLQKTGCVED